MWKINRKVYNWNSPHVVKNDLSKPNIALGSRVYNFHEGLSVSLSYWSSSSTVSSYSTRKDIIFIPTR